MKDEKGRTVTKKYSDKEIVADAPRRPSPCVGLHPALFILHPSSFILGS